MDDTQVQRTLRQGPVVIVCAAAALAVATLLLSLTWGTTEPGLTVGEQAARRQYVVGVALLAPLVAVTLLSAHRARGRRPSPVGWMAAPAALLVWLAIF